MEKRWGENEKRWGEMSEYEKREWVRRHISYDTDKIKEVINIEDAIKYYTGITVKNIRQNISCPSGHKDNNPSAHVNPHRNNCYCFSCQQTFDVFSLAEQYHNVGFREAVRQVLADFNLPLGEYSNLHTLESRIDDMSRRQAEWQRAKQEREEAEWALLERYLPPKRERNENEIAETTQRPYVPEEKKPFIAPMNAGSTENVMGYLTQERGISPNIVEDCIARGTIYEEQRPHWQNTYINAIFAGFDDNGQMRYAARRGINGKLKRDCCGSEKTYAFGIAEDGRKYAEVYVTEAAIDALSLASLEDIFHGQGAYKEKAYISTGGAASEKALDRFLEKHPETRVINVCYDNDKPGKDGIERLRSKYEPLGYTVNAMHPEKKKDYNEELTAYRQNPAFYDRPPKTIAEVMPVRQTQPELPISNAELEYIRIPAAGGIVDGVKLPPIAEMWENNPDFVLELVHDRCSKLYTEAVAANNQYCETLRTWCNYPPEQQETIETAYKFMEEYSEQILNGEILATEQQKQQADFYRKALFALDMVTKKMPEHIEHIKEIGKKTREIMEERKQGRDELTETVQK